MGDARRAALTALEKCRRSGAWSDAVLGGVLDAEGLTDRDRRLAAALCYGVTQNRMLLDETIRRVSSLPPGRVEPKVLDILRISVYQLLFLDKIPKSAAVNEGVKLCRALGYQRAAGYVNAVLRRVGAHPALPEPEGEIAERLSLRYSHPRWLVDFLLERLGEEETRQLLQCDNLPVPATLQVNTLKTSAAELGTALAQAGVEAEPHPFLPDCLTAENAGELFRTSAFRDGWFYVQDAAAKYAVMAAEPRAGQRILDVCAAPGGKSFASAILSGGRAEITACDLHEKKLKRLRESAGRLGLELTAFSADAGENRAEWNGAFDLVFADVPCSGLGVIRKKPDIRYKDPADFGGLPPAQARILKNAARYVSPGGLLLYSTCTVRDEENGGVIRSFLAEDQDFVPENFSSPWGDESVEGMLQLWPQRQGTDGFFIAKLRKRK